MGLFTGESKQSSRPVSTRLGLAAGATVLSVLTACASSKGGETASMTTPGGDKLPTASFKNTVTYFDNRTAEIDLTNGSGIQFSTTFASCVAGGLYLIGKEGSPSHALSFSANFAPCADGGLDLGDLSSTMLPTIVATTLPIPPTTN